MKTIKPYYTHETLLMRNWKNKTGVGNNIKWKCVFNYLKELWEEDVITVLNHKFYKGIKFEMFKAMFHDREEQVFHLYDQLKTVIKEDKY